ncbi:acyltransferase [Tardiphaga sp. 862_B3_N1_1]|uniref:acyltransferase n=1 Tax=Tardiphaga sp. 862_B3_N1_1 TaxID=3240763 RepID=UPI003F8C737D
MTKHWDHAFASGGVYKRPGGVGLSRLIDPFFWVAEKLYGDYCVRRLWTVWDKAAVCAPSVSLGGNARLINKHVREAVRIGDNTVCRGTIRVEPGGTLTIGEEVYLGDDTIISAAQQITIGSGTLVAHRVQIFDNTSHSIDWKEREQHFRKILGQKVDRTTEIPSASVTIGKNCWLGFGSAILKGVTIGDRSIVAAGCIVTDNVPPDTLVVGSKTTFIDLNRRA